MSNNCGGGSVSGADALVVAVGMVGTSDQGCSTCYVIGDCECKFGLIVGQESEKVVKKGSDFQIRTKVNQREAFCAVSNKYF